MSTLAVARKACNVVEELEGLSEQGVFDVLHLALLAMGMAHLIVESDSDADTGIPASEEPHVFSKADVGKRVRCKKSDRVGVIVCCTDHEDPVLVCFDDGSLVRYYADGRYRSTDIEPWLILAEPGE